ncbi:hypothetical protein LP52_21145 [Streptomonospora alba]|uniref:Uncharacterized protein n=1 Tax=Streptomonospora alba TaxID=183763 RepID=A0A0C2G190_9ACTN|nr:hypothetical protein LP52_21145 [Streptomonospora alba]
MCRVAEGGPTRGRASGRKLEEPLKVSGGRVAFRLRPFQILTLRLARGQAPPRSVGHTRAGSG